MNIWMQLIAVEFHFAANLAPFDSDAVNRTSIPPRDSESVFGHSLANRNFGEQKSKRGGGATKFQLAYSRRTN
jgi:hypothetical protein